MFPRPRARRDGPMTLFCVALDDEDIMMYLLSRSAADFRARGVPVSYLRRFKHVLSRYDPFQEFHHPA